MTDVNMQDSSAPHPTSLPFRRTSSLCSTHAAVCRSVFGKCNAMRQSSRRSSKGALEQLRVR